MASEIAFDVTTDPVIANLNGDVATYDENKSFFGVLDQGADALVTDPDSGDFNGGSLTLSITSGLIASEDVLGVVGVGVGTRVQVSGSNISVDTGSGYNLIGTFTGGTNGDPLVISFTTADATPAAVTLLMHVLVYNNSQPLGAATAGVREVTYVLDDGDGSSTTITSTVNVTAVNDLPSVDLNGTGFGNNGINVTRAYTENATAISIAPAAIVKDIDNPTLASATVTFTSGFLSGEDSLTINGSESGTIGAITFSFSDATGIMSLTGAGTLAEYQAAIRLISFSSTSDTPGTVRTLSVVVNDGTDPSATAVVTINVTPVDDPTVAVDDFFTTDEANAVTGGNVFSANPTTADSDPDSALLVTAVNGNAASVGVQITLASGALLTLNSDGTFTYDPNGAFDSLPGEASGASNLSGTDSFTYEVNGTATATVTITLSGIDTTGDILLGTAGNDSLIGGIGADAMYGYAGDDRYDVNDVGDTVFEAAGEGFDVVRTSVDFDARGQEIEVIRAVSMTGLALTAGNNATRLVGDAGDDFLRGSDFDDVLIGNGGDDTLAGGAGADRMKGGTGDDRYFVTDAGDRVIDLVGEGRDVVLTTVNFSAGSQEIEVIRANSDIGLTLTASKFGSSVSGRGGDDTLIGRAGRDTLIGGAGKDILTGGGDLDIFVFDDGDSAATVADADHITDFDHAEHDKINLSRIDAIDGGGDDAFSFIGTAAFENIAGQLRYEVVGGETHIFGDTDGNGVADFTIVLDAATPLVAGDFVL